jgi:hypothetical protein
MRKKGHTAAHAVAGVSSGKGLTIARQASSNASTVSVCIARWQGCASDLA